MRVQTGERSVAASSFWPSLEGRRGTAPVFPHTILFYVLLLKASVSSESLRLCAHLASPPSTSSVMEQFGVRQCVHEGRPRSSFQNRTITATSMVCCPLDIFFQFLFYSIP